MASVLGFHSAPCYLRLVKKQVSPAHFYLCQRAVRSFCNDSNDGSGNNNDKTTGTKKLEALLESLKVEGATKKDESKIVFNLDLARPKRRRNNAKKTKQEKPVKEEVRSEDELEQPLVDAAKKVAASFNDEDTAAELVDKLKAHKAETQEARSKGMQLLDLVANMKVDNRSSVKKSKDKRQNNLKIDFKSNSSREERSEEQVASQPKMADSESTDTAQGTRENMQQKPAKKINLTDMFVGMKIDRTKKEQPRHSAMDVENTSAKRSKRQDFREKRGLIHIKDQMGQRVNLFGGDSLDVFSSAQTDESDDSTWANLNQRELRLAVTHPPKNPYEEMIRWTAQGKLWTFPIDNEYGLTDEVNVGFQEHVFIQTELEHGFPSSGPIRVFMELVCNGLSKNPYISLERKKEHIEWYRKYFKDKEELLKCLDVKVSS